MDDSRIVELYWARNEDALHETDTKYGAYLGTIAYHILYDREDSEECVNDTYLKAWNSMPPHKPELLRIFLGKITRECSIDRYRRRGAKKRRSEYEISLAELGDCVSGGDSPEDMLELKRLAEAIESFLRGESADNRKIFLCRYYFLDPMKDIAEYFACSESKVKSILYRMRQKLKAYLEKEGFEL